MTKNDLHSSFLLENLFIYLHGDDKDNNVKENGENQSPEIMTRLFDLMEVFSSRLAKLEMQIWESWFTDEISEKRQMHAEKL